tara:strand:+ start:11253 stop:11570 length:318 start_codon:yes stop_codon:yes gene_type:complete
MSYAESATDGNLMGMLRFAVLNGALWAVGSSWSTAIRAVMLQIVPRNSQDVVVGEILAAMVTTVASIAVSYAVMQKGCCQERDIDTDVTQDQNAPSNRQRRSSHI